MAAKWQPKRGIPSFRLRPALVPIKTAGDTAKKLQGLALKNARVALFFNNKKREQAFGELLFTHFGLSGPIILTLSGQIVDALDSGVESHCLN